MRTGSNKASGRAFFLFGRRRLFTEKLQEENQGDTETDSTVGNVEIRPDIFFPVDNHLPFDPVANSLELKAVIEIPGGSACKETKGKYEAGTRGG